MSSPIRLLVVMLAFGTAAMARAQEWPRYHAAVGIGVSTADFGTDWESAGVSEFIRPTRELDRASGSPWRLSAGFRPLRTVGAEIAYISLGNAKAEDGYSPNASVRLGDYWLKARASATVLTTVLFIPDSSPSFDFYGKVGIAEYKETFDVHVSNWTPMCRLLPFGQAPECLFDNQGDQTDSRTYLGLGARIRIASNWAVRIEYDVLGDLGDHTMLSLNIAWER